MLQPNPNAGSGPSSLLAVLSRPSVLPLAIFAWLAATAWLRPLSLPDEGRYVGVALEMLWSGNWLVPTLDTLPYFHKPPLFYWLTAASMATFGINEWAARLCSLLAATGCALGVYHFLRRWAGEAHARLALLVLLTTPFFYGGAQFANLDMLVAACIAGTILCAAHAVLAAGDGPLPRPRACRRLCPGGARPARQGADRPRHPRHGDRHLARGHWPAQNDPSPGLAAGNGPVRHPRASLVRWRCRRDFRGSSTTSSSTTTSSASPRRASTAVRPFWFLVAAFAGATLPWFVFLAAAVRRRGQAQESSLPGQVHALMWIWLVSTLVFFSIPSSKLIGYVLVAVPPLGALAAEGLTRFAGTPVRERLMTVRVAGVALLVLAAMLIGVTWRDRSRDKTREFAAQLASRASPADMLVALHDYPFSLPFYLRRPPPISIVDYWQRARSTQKDSWRRELYEAAEFARAEWQAPACWSRRDCAPCSPAPGEPCG